MEANGNNSNLGYSMAPVPNHHPVLSLNCICVQLDTLLKVALDLCFKIRAILDIIFLKTDFERTAKELAISLGLLLPYRWTRVEGYLG